MNLRRVGLHNNLGRYISCRLFHVKQYVNTHRARIMDYWTGGIDQHRVSNRTCDQVCRENRVNRGLRGFLWVQTDQYLL